MYRKIFKPLLFSLEPETAHQLSVNMGNAAMSSSLTRGVLHRMFGFEHRFLAQKIGALYFPNPIGIAAGFDKNAELTSLLSSFGFGFLEVGSVTARPSKGNPQPRSFRLPQDEALINRMGLNNHGAEVVAKRLSHLGTFGPLGVNIAKTHDPSILGTKAIDDYVASFALLQPHADYITLNVSCPNTEEGKTFEDPEALTALLQAVLPLRKDSNMPVFVKLSVDVSDNEIVDLARICLDNGADGFVISNTSSQRNGLVSPAAEIERIGRGGLSGKPIAQRSTQLIRAVRTFSGPNVPIIGVGGIDSTKAALLKIAAGANLVQLYTGLVYHGPGVVKRIKRDIVELMQAHDVEHIDDLRDVLNA